MHFQTLHDLFADYAREIDQLKEPSARFRAINYYKVANIIKQHYNNNDDVTKDKIDKLPISSHMKDKANEFLKNPKLKPKLSLKTELTNIMGIGDEKAKTLIKQGLKNIKQLEQPKWQEQLTDESKIFLKVKPLNKIPHETIRNIEPILHKLEDCKVQIVGSYRRKTPFSKDIDVLVLSEKNNILEEIDKQLPQLFKHVYSYAKGPDKLSTVVEFDKEYLKIDFFRVSAADYIPTLLYTTGSKHFNINMRRKAKSKGYLLNQNGLFIKKNNELQKIENLHTEKAYFDVLGMDYLEPQNRT